MKAQFNIYRPIIQAAGLIILALVLIVGGSWLIQPALAQEPEPTTEPADGPDTEPPLPTDPGDVAEIAPPDEAELGEPVREEGYITRDDMEDSEGGVIDIFDLAFVASRYDTDDPAADLNLDGVVDIFDLSILASHYDQAEPPANAAGIATPVPLPVVEEESEFGSFELPVEAEQLEVDSQAYIPYRPLRIGVGLNYVKVYDNMDSTSAPDLYSLVAVGRVPVRTGTIFNQYQIWPNWRLGWWRYHSFPRPAWYTPEAKYYTTPIELEIRDDDGYICYGYYGCRHRFQLADVSSLLYQRPKKLNFAPASCTVTDEAGVSTQGYWLDHNRCRVYLHAWGSEWPRAYVSYFIEAWWE